MTQRLINCRQFCRLPKLEADESKISIFRLVNNDVSLFNYDDTIKMTLMMLDASFTTLDDAEESLIATSESFVIDGKDVSFRHFMQIAKNFKTAKLFLKYVQEAAPFNIKSLHFINSSTIVDKIFTLVRPFVNKDLLKVIHFHGHELESLHKHISVDFLPSEYGGRLGSVDEMYKETLKLLEDKK